ncbi:MAG TPA: DUF2785 domain-containing protein [Streptosporangiaceae bacterium]|nr:DUF2785 domain-containing protein [Streptosporangiaceae bacterium]
MTNWGEVLENDFAVPPGRPSSELAAELYAMLGSPDPKVRDDTAFPVLAYWVSRGVFDGQLAVVGGELIARISDGPIYQRTFATISLTWVLLRDAKTSELNSATVLGWLATFSQWWRNETDLRPWDPELGWLHAPAHGADLLRAFGRSPKLGAAELAGLLELAVDRLMTDQGYLYGNNEDDRIASALASVLVRPEVSADAAVGWIGRLHDAVAAGEPGPVPPWAANSLRTLAALYVMADRGVSSFDPETNTRGPVVRLPHAAGIKDRLAEALRVPWAGLG